MLIKAPKIDGEAWCSGGLEEPIFMERHFEEHHADERADYKEKWEHIPFQEGTAWQEARDIAAKYPQHARGILAKKGAFLVRAERRTAEPLRLVATGKKEEV